MPGYYYGGFYGGGYALVLIAALLSLIASANVQMTFKRYSNKKTSRNITAEQAARKILDENGLQNVRIESIAGNLTDHYDPRKRVLRLSESVCNVNSIAAVSVACHEAGHALQHANGYAPLKIRNSIVPLVNFASNFSWILVVIGIGLLASNNYIGDTVFNIGVIMMVIVILFHTVTLPVEFNASSRALKQMEELAIIDEDEEVGAKKVLRAAALTYVAALAVAIGNLLRMLALRGRD